MIPTHIMFFAEANQNKDFTQTILESNHPSQRVLPFPFSN